MIIDIRLRHDRDQDAGTLRQTVHELAQRHLERPLSGLSLEGQPLHVTVDRDKHGIYTAALRLLVPPRKVLVAGASDDDLLSALREAFEELERQGIRHRDRIQRRESYRRKARRERLQQLEQAHPVQATAGKDTRGILEQDLIRRLEDFVRHELAYLRSTGDLLPEDPSVEDIRDEALLAVSDWNALIDGTDPEAAFAQLVQGALTAIERALEENRLARREDSLDAAPPEDAEDQAERMVQEQFHEFYQPDEALRIEDLIPQPDARTPEDPVLTQETDAFFRLLGTLPATWRRTLILVHREGIRIEDVAEQVLHVPTEDAQRWLDQAEAFLQAHLEQLGLTQRPLEEHLANLSREKAAKALGR